MKSLKSIFNKKVAQMFLLMFAFFCAVTAGLIGAFGTNKRSEDVFAEQSVQVEQNLESETPDANGNWINEAVSPNYVQNMASGDKYTISRPEHLAWLAVRVNGGTICTGETYELTADINLGGKFWTPIGNSTNKFAGTLVGNGHIISGMMLESSGALFNALGSSAVVKDIIIKNTYNAAYALTSATSSGSVYNCASEGVELLYNTSGMTCKHNSSNGTLLPTSGTQTFDSQYIGVNNVYVEFWIKYIDLEGSEHAISYDSTGKLKQGAQAYLDEDEDFFEISRSNNSFGWKNDYGNATVADFKISEYVVGSGGGNWEEKLKESSGSTQQKNVCDFIEFTFVRRQAKRGYTKKDKVWTESGVTIFHLAEIQLAHQTAIKIEITLMPKLVDTTLTLQKIGKGSNSENFSNLNAVYANPKGATINWTSVSGTQIKVTSGGKTITGDDVTYTHRDGATLKVEIASGCYTGIALANDTSWSKNCFVEVTTTSTIKLRNLYKYTFKYDQIDIKDNILEVTNPQSKVAYLITEFNGDWLERLITNGVQSTVMQGNHILATLYISSNDLANESIKNAGNPTNIFIKENDDAKQFKDDDPTRQMLREWGNEATIYCSWVLETYEVEIKFDSNNSEHDFEIGTYVQNPYSGTAYNIESAGVAGKENTFYIPATFKTAVFVTGNDNANYSLGVKAGGNNLNTNAKVLLYEQAKDHAGTLIKGTKMGGSYECSNASGAVVKYFKAVQFDILSDASYLFYAEEKSVQFNVAVEGGGCISGLNLKDKTNNRALITYPSIPTTSSPYNNKQLFSVLNTYSFNWTFSARGHRFVQLYAVDDKGNAIINTTLSTGKPILYVDFAIIAGNVVDGQIINLVLVFDSYENSFIINFADEDGVDPREISSDLIEWYKNPVKDDNGTITYYYTLKYIQFAKNILGDGVIIDNIGLPGTYGDKLLYSSTANTLANVTYDAGVIKISQEALTDTAGFIIEQRIAITIGVLPFKHINGQADPYQITVRVKSEEYLFTINAIHQDSDGSTILDAGYSVTEVFNFTYKSTFSKTTSGVTQTYTIGAKTTTFRAQSYFTAGENTQGNYSGYSGKNWLDTYGKNADNYSITLTFIPEGINLHFIERYYYNGWVTSFNGHNTLKTTTYNGGEPLWYTGLNGQNVQFIKCDYYYGYAGTNSTHFSINADGTTNAYSEISNSTKTYYNLTKFITDESSDLIIYANYRPYVYTFEFTGGIDHTIKDAINGGSRLGNTEKSYTITTIYNDLYKINDKVNTTIFEEGGYEFNSFKWGTEDVGFDVLLKDIIIKNEDAKGSNQTFKLLANYVGKKITINLFLIKEDGSASGDSGMTIEATYDEWLNIVDPLVEKSEALRQAGNLVKYWKDQNKANKIARVKQDGKFLDEGAYLYSTSALTCEQCTVPVGESNYLNFAPYWDDFKNNEINIYGYYVETIVEVIFDGRHLTPQSDKTLYTYYGSNIFYTTLKETKADGIVTRKWIEGETDAPTPTRNTYYTFEYWKDAGGKYIVGSAQDVAPILETQPIKLFAYWAIKTDASMITNNSYANKIYDSIDHALKNTITQAPDMQNEGTVSVVKTGNYANGFTYKINYDKVTNSATYIQRAQYVPDSGKYTITYTFSFEPINTSIYKTKEEFVSYITNYPYATGVQNTFEISIAPYQLSFGNYTDGKFNTAPVTKMYDGDNEVEQQLDIFSADAGIFMPRATYQQTNAGKDIELNFDDGRPAGTDDVWELIYVSYTLPNVKGEITAFEIYVSIAETIKYINDSPFVLVSGKFNNKNNDITQKAVNAQFTNEISTCELLGVVNRTIEYTIKTASGKLGTYKASDGGIVVEFSVGVGNGTNGEPFDAGEANNYIFVFAEGSEIIIDGIKDDEIYIVFIAKESFVNYLGTESISDAGEEKSNAKISMDGENVIQINDFKFTKLIKSTVNLTETLTIKITSLNTNWWHERLIIQNKTAGTEEIISLFKDGTGELSFNYTFAPKNEYEIDLVFTDQSKITYDLGLIGTEEATKTPSISSSIARYGQPFNIPDAGREGLEFLYWLQPNGSELGVMDGGLWEIKGNLTLYAKWSYKTTITLSAQNIQRDYDPTIQDIYSYENGNINNSALTYSYAWQKDGAEVLNSTNNGTVIYIKNVKDSGTYKFAFTINNIPAYALGAQTIASIDMYVTIEDNLKNAYNDDIGFVVKINPKELTLNGEINKIFNGTNSLTYEILDTDVDAKFSEVVGRELFVTYSSANVGSSVVSVKAVNNADAVLVNYTLKANGTITPLDIVVAITANNEIGTKVVYDQMEFVQRGNQHFVTFTDSVVSIGNNDVEIKANIANELTSLPTGIDFSITSIVSSNKNVGEYAGLDNTLQNYLRMSFSARYGGNDISESNINVTVEGSIIIVPKALTGVSITWDKVYNTENQNVSVFIFENIELTPNTEYCVVERKVQNSEQYNVFTGATNVGEYDGIKVTIKYPNYIWEEITGIFKITPYDVYVKVTNGNISKTYDATDVANLIYGIDYKLLVANKADSDEIAQKYLNNINTETYYSFNFADKNVAENKNITLTNYSSNYTFTLIGRVTGKIVHKQVVINVKEISKTFDEQKFTVAYSNLDVELAGNEQLLSGNITINIINAKTYDLSDNAITYEVDLYVNDNGKKITDNYAVTGLDGYVTINKANINIEVFNEDGSPLNKDYTYSGTTQNIKFKATRTNDNAVITDIMNVAQNNGVNVGEHNVTFAVDATHASNYEYDEETAYAFNIIPKKITITVNASKVYDGNKFRYELNSKDANLPLGEGDYFAEVPENGNSVPSYFETMATYVWSYSLAKDEVYLYVIIQDESGNIVYNSKGMEEGKQANYEIDYDVALNITYTTITIDDIIAEPKEYNGSIQDVEFTALTFAVDFVGIKDNKVFTTEYDDGRYITTTFGRLINNSTLQDSDFKYAGTYSISLESNMFVFEGAFTLKINPKIITAESISTTQMVGKNLEERAYDGTSNVNLVITSTDIYSENNVESTKADDDHDTTYIKLKGTHKNGEYDAVFGSTTILIEFNNGISNGSQLSEEELKLMADSYQLDDNFAFTGKIFEKEVVLKYNPKTIYYTGIETTLYVGTDLSVSTEENEGLVLGENLTGSATFNAIVNANTYNLNEQDNITTDFTISVGSNLAYYTFKFEGELEIKKAKIFVSSIENNSYVYDANENGKRVVLTAEIKDYCGEIPNFIDPRGLLTATYKLDGTNTEIEKPINAGTYHIKPAVNSSYLNNFEYVGDEWLNVNSYKLTIEKLQVVIKAGKTYVLYDDAVSQYTYDIKDDLEATINPENAPAPINGHNAFGELIINKEKAGVSADVTIKYIGVNDEKVRLEGFKISDGTNIFDANYDVTFNIQIVYTIEVHDGDAIGVQKNELTYKAENLIDEITISVTLDIDSREDFEDIREIDIKSGENNDYAEIIGFYLTESDAQNNVNSQSEIINATKVNGEYYAKTRIKVQNANSEYIYTKITVKQKIIYTLSYGNASYDGKKVYDGLSYLELLSSSDICEPDKGTISVKATYPSENVGKNYVVNFSIVNDNNENYKLNSATMNGEITPKKVQIVKYQDSTNYEYLAGGQTIMLGHDKFTIDATNNVLAGHEINGTIDVDVTNSGNYLFFEYGKKKDYTTINLAVMDGAVEVTDNYEFVIDDYTEENGLMLVLQKARVEINWDRANAFIYGATYYTNNVKEKLTYTTPDAKNYIGDITFEYFNARLEKETTTNVYNAGEYVINSVVESANYIYIVGANNVIYVNKKTAQINIGEQVKSYREYVTSGYNVSDDMVSGAFATDMANFNKTIYKISSKISNKIIAGYTYYAQAGQSIEGTLVEYSAIVFTYENIISNNYTIEVSGYIKINPEELSIQAFENLVYNSSNQFKDIKLKLIGENGAEQIFTIGTYYDDGDQTSFTLDKRSFTITNFNGANDVRNVGTHTINMVIDTVPKQVTVTIVPFALTVNYQMDKEYDGTNNVYGTGKVTNLTSNAFAGDDVTITATYASDKYREDAQEITFVATGDDAGNYSLPNDKTGKIGQKQLVLELNQTLTYQYTNSYTLVYSGNIGVDVDFVSNANIPFGFADATKNAVGTYNLTSDILTLILDNFKIGRTATNPQEDTTYCYNIEIKGNVTIEAKKFSVVFNPISDTNKVVFDNTEKEITYVLNDGAGAVINVDDEEYGEVRIRIVYTNNNIELGEGNLPKNAGVYVVKANYVGTSNYIIINLAEQYVFEITKYIYTVESSNEINSFSKEYNTSDPDLTQSFTAMLSTGENYPFGVIYTREDGEEIDVYDFISYTCTDANIEFVVEGEFLKEKFAITKNTTQTVIINLTSYINGDFVRYYGLSNIGVFDLADFTYLCQVGGKEVEAGFGEDLNVANYENQVTFDGKNVGTGYKVIACSIGNAKNFTNFEVVSELEFEIAKRTLLIWVIDDNALDALGAYDKVYDGDDTFEKNLTLDYNFEKASQGELSSDEINLLNPKIHVAYNDSNVAGAQYLTASLQTEVGNFELVFKDTLRANTNEIDASILPLDIEINLNNHEKTYGDALNIEYNVNHASTKITNDVVKENLTLSLVDSLGLNAELSTSGNVVVGTHYIKAAENNSNYKITNTNASGIILVDVNNEESHATYNVSKKALTITFATKPSKTQDGTKSIDLNEFPVTIVGIVSGDDVGVEKAEYESEIASDGIEIVFTLNGIDSSNYSTNKAVGEIVERMIKFLFNYSYLNCPVSLEQIKENTRVITSINFNYYKTIGEQLATLPSPMYENGGYKFMGWSLSDDNLIAIGLDVTIDSFIDTYVEEQNLYAIWEIQNFKITIVEAKYNVETDVYDQVNQIEETINYATVISFENAGNVYSINDEGNGKKLIVPIIENFNCLGYGNGNINVAIELSVNYVVTDSDATLYIMYYPKSVELSFNANKGAFNVRNESIFNYSTNANGDLVAEKQLLYGEKIGDAINIDLTSYLSANRIGYKFISWQYDGEDYQVANIAQFVITENTEFVINWEALTYTLTLHAGEGEFEADNVNSSDWNYIDENDHTVIIITTTYDQAMPEFIVPTRAYYGFVGYKNASLEEWTKLEDGLVWIYETWTQTDNIELFAIYAQNSYLLTITTDAHSNISFNAKDGNGVEINIVDTNEDVNVFVFNVQTEYSITITAGASEGYNFKEFVAEGTNGSAEANIYKIISFIGDATIEVRSNPRNNEITLRVVDTTSNNLSPIYGKLQTEYDSGTYSTDTNGYVTLTVPTETELNIDLLINEGYKLVAWELNTKEIGGTGTIGELVDLSEIQKTLKGFLCDVTITVELEPMELEIKVINNEERGSYTHNSRPYNSGDTFKIKTGQEFRIRIVLNYGYSLSDENGFEFITISENKGIFKLDRDTADNTGMSYYLSLSGITANGEFEISYIVNKYKITLEYADYDENNNSFIKQTPAGAIALVDGVQQGSCVIEKEYKTEIVIKQIYEKEGYKFKAYYSYNTGKFTQQTANENGELELIFDQDYTIYIVFEREIYNVVFEINDTRHGSIRTLENSMQVASIYQEVRYGRSSYAVMAIATDEYRVFKGWKIKNADETYADKIYTDNGDLTYTLDAQTITGNTTFVAVFEGGVYEFDIVIKQNSKYDAYENFDNIVKKTIESEGYEIGEVDYDDVNYIITVPITYSAGDNVNFELQLNEYYQLVRNGAVTDNNVFAITNVIPSRFTNDTYTIELALRYYKVVVNTDTVDALEIDSINWNVSNRNEIKNETYNNKATTLFEAEVQYGATLSLFTKITHGYTCKEQVGERTFEFNADKSEARLTEILGALEITFKFVPTRYKITFETNYPRQDVYGKPFVNPVPKPQETHVLYIEQDGTIIKNASFADARNSNAFKALLNAQEFSYEGAIFGFNGWSITTQAINREFFFDEERNYIIYYLDSAGNPVDGFAYPLEGTLDENDNIAITLYGTWYVPEYNLRINYIPEALSGAYDYDKYFDNQFGFNLVVNKDDPSLVARVFNGVTVKMYNLPIIDGFDYYGWSLNDEDVINQASSPIFTILGQDATINLYYRFKIRVKVDESIEGVNTATVNNEKEVWCLTGEELKFVATPGKGFDFAYWLVDGEIDTTLPQEFTINATEKKEYIAVFVGKTVNIIFNNIEHTVLTTESNFAQVGDQIKINVESVENGYILQMLMVNNFTTGVEKDASGKFYTYTITQDDGELGDIFIDAIISAMEIKIQFNVVDNTTEPEYISENKLEIEIAKVIVNENNLTNGFWTYNYAQEITINVKAEVGFNLIAISINDKPLNSIMETIKIKLTEDGGINIGSANVIKFEFKKIYWLDEMQEFAGDGASDNPYVISNAETLAKLAHLINSGAIDSKDQKLHFKVTEDIELNEKFWVPIGTAENPFNGVFDLGKHTITGPMFAQSYPKCDWEKYCPGIFAFVAEEAEIILERSMTPTIIIIVAIVAVIIFALVVSVIIIRSKKKKIKKLSNNLGITNMQKVTLDKEEETVEEINLGNELDDELKEIVQRANQELAEQKPNIPKKPPTKPSGKPHKINPPAKPPVSKKSTPPPKKPKV